VNEQQKGLQLVRTRQDPDEASVGYSKQAAVPENE